MTDLGWTHEHESEYQLIGRLRWHGLLDKPTIQDEDKHGKEDADDDGKNTS